ncbi:hypothetical protein HYFRA_00003312 [Hymenoscyphus fraxineus]|uniref:Uncharacterized protein n=1 Tax=Hymenoscyphus fraxineus TaxID=746836 RepID=A0A9N9KVZ8_9HELO|nr:hypothetical protein HYFRA_00003312 [Hymenoscyphus fraxineus]
MTRPKPIVYTFLGDTVPFSQSLKGHMFSLANFILALCFIFVAGISFFIGQTGVRPKVDNCAAKGPELNIPLRSVSYTFAYNRTFVGSSERTDQAWKELFPPQNGYFTHPEIAPERSTLSVYHQLHCLNGIRKGYWRVHDLAIAGKKLKDDDLPMMLSPPHIRHCIDLLRQSLMCNADTTVEKKDEKAGGVHGFGVQHRCKHWFQLVDWTTKAQEKYNSGH